MNHHRSDASACSVAGCIVIVGGFNGNECLNTTEMYDPVAREWRDLPRMGSRRSGVGSVSFRDYVYAVGKWGILALGPLGLGICSLRGLAIGLWGLRFGQTLGLWFFFGGLLWRVLRVFMGLGF